MSLKNKIKLRKLNESGEKLTKNQELVLEVIKNNNGISKADIELELRDLSRIGVSLSISKLQEYGMVRTGKSRGDSNKFFVSENLNEADGDPIKEGDSVKIIKDGDFKGKKGKIVSISNNDKAIRDFVVEIDGSRNNFQTGDFYNISENKVMSLKNKIKGRVGLNEEVKTVSIKHDDQDVEVQLYYNPDSGMSRIQSLAIKGDASVMMSDLPNSDRSKIRKSVKEVVEQNGGLKSFFEKGSGGQAKTEPKKEEPKKEDSKPNNSKLKTEKETIEDILAGNESNYEIVENKGSYTINTEKRTYNVTKYHPEMEQNTLMFSKKDIENSKKITDYLSKNNSTLIQKEDYDKKKMKENFKKNYGNINPEKVWDERGEKATGGRFSFMSDIGLGGKLTDVAGTNWDKKTFKELPKEAQDLIKETVKSLSESNESLKDKIANRKSLNESVTKLFEVSDKLTKENLANVLTINAVNGREFKSADISDDVLDTFNKGWKNIYKQNPKFDPYNDDVEMEDSDVFDDFMSLITSLGKKDSKISLFENFNSSKETRKKNKIKLLESKKLVKLNEGKITSEITKSDVEQVAKDLKIKLKPETIQKVLENYDSAKNSDDDSEENWTLIVENLIHELNEDKVDMHSAIMSAVMKRWGGLTKAKQPFIDEQDTFIVNIQSDVNDKIGKEPTAEEIGNFMLKAVGVGLHEENQSLSFINTSENGFNTILGEFGDECMETIKNALYKDKDSADVMAVYGVNGQPVSDVVSVSEDCTKDYKGLDEVKKVRIGLNEGLMVNNKGLSLVFVKGDVKEQYPLLESNSKLIDFYSINNIIINALDYNNTVNKITNSKTSKILEVISLTISRLKSKGGKKVITDIVDLLTLLSVNPIINYSLAYAIENNIEVNKSYRDSLIEIFSSLKENPRDLTKFDEEFFKNMEIK